MASEQMSDREAVEGSDRKQTLEPQFGVQLGSAAYLLGDLMQGTAPLRTSVFSAVKWA